MKRKMSSVLTVRLDEDSLDKLEDLAGDDDNRTSKSEVVRRLVEQAKDSYAESPYFSASTRDVLLVDREGAFHWHREECLRLNRDLNEIPAFVAMKSDRVGELLQRNMDRHEWVRCWGRHGFRVYAEGCLPERVPAFATDPNGLTFKRVILTGLFLSRRKYVRESFAVLPNYARRFSAVSTSEHSAQRKTDALNARDQYDAVIQIPTREYELLVIIDRAVYARTVRFGVDAEVDPGFQIVEATLEGVETGSSAAPGDRFVRKATVALPEPEARHGAAKAKSPRIPLGELEVRRALQRALLCMETVCQEPTSVDCVLVRRRNLAAGATFLVTWRQPE